MLAPAYPDPVPGFIFTAVVCSAMVLWAAIVAIKTFAPFGRPSRVAQRD